MKILYCTDGSKISYNALDNMSFWVKDAEIDTICVIDWSFLPDNIDFENQNFVELCANSADSILNYSKNKIIELGYKSEKLIKNCGSAIESILETVKSDNYDLILMGSNGKKGIQKWLGSVSQEIIKSSEISDYIVKNTNCRKRLLITTDGTQCSEGIIEDILHDLKLEDKEVHICMVNEEPSLLFLDGNLDEHWLSDIKKRQNIYANEAINKISEILKSANISVDQTAILSGNPAKEIIEYERENKIDLTILGSRNKSKLDRFLTGSESKRILENTMSDVWLARCKN
jgi:nucleotide-binding universal stress UspA family protein